MGIKYKTLVEHFQREPEVASRNLRENIRSKDVRPADFEFGRLFEECYGWDAYKACRNKERFPAAVMNERDGAMEPLRISEATGAVTTSIFQNISGQIVYGTTLDAYMAEDNVFSAL